MGKFSSQTITGKSDETESVGGNSADESRSDSKQPDGNTGKKFTNFIINNLGKLSSQLAANLMKDLNLQLNLSVAIAQMNPDQIPSNMMEILVRNSQILLSIIWANSAHIHRQI